MARATKKNGRPSVYEAELAEAICLRLMEGQSLRHICSAEDMPAASTVFYWLTKKDHPFLEQYTRARELQAEFAADDLLELADDTSSDVMGERNAPNSVAVQRAKLRIETRKWIASKLLPKKYGDRVQAEVSGEVAVVKRVVNDL